MMLNFFKKFTITLFLTTIFNYTFCQSVSVWETGKVVDTNASVFGAIADDWERSLTVDNQPIKLYQSPRNRSINGKFGSEYSEFQYFYEPEYEIASVIFNNKTNAAAEIYLEIILRPKPLDVDKIFKYIQRNVNPRVLKENIHPLKVFAYYVFYPLGSQQVIKDQPGGWDFNQELTAFLEFDNIESAEFAYDKITKNGSALDFGYSKFIKRTKTYNAKITGRQIIQSNVLRDYISPVVGKSVWAFHSYVVSQAIGRELNISSIREDDRDPLIPSAIQPNLFNLLGFKENEIPIKDVASKLVNINGTRFATDELYNIGYDARRMTNEEWCEKMNEEYLNSNEEKELTGIEGGAEVDFWGIKGGGNGSKKSQQQYSETLKRLLSTEDCGKSLIESTFKYDEGYKKYEPKTIVVHDIVNIASEIKLNSEVSDVSMSQSYVNTIKQVRLKK